MEKSNSTNRMTMVIDIWLQLRETVDHAAMVTSGERNYTQPEESRAAHLW